MFGRARDVHENIVDNYFWCSICAAEAAQIEHQIYNHFVHPSRGVLYL